MMKLKSITGLDNDTHEATDEIELTLRFDGVDHPIFVEMRNLETGERGLVNWSQVATCEILGIKK